MVSGCFLLCDTRKRDSVKFYEKDQRPKLKENIWLSKEYMIQINLLPYFDNRNILIKIDCA
ncbi:MULTISPECIES: hypothetical protein [Bacillota]|uniref:hypothetical protein n=1 Tax=Bacillota TaxID=1239 RepID=UPI0018A6C656|nr:MULTISPECIES: hypothetical protein [Bacillota]MDY4670637.1 hypothetical protein [Oliverpabstia sp.]MDY5232895.1 hypothetical protein [Faecalicoccus sp.]MDY5436652.1 hypothetical protein [Peptostreptococcus porci]